MGEKGRGEASKFEDREKSGEKFKECHNEGEVGALSCL